MRTLKNKVAIVTGGTGALGRAVVLEPPHNPLIVLVFHPGPL